MQNHSLPFSLFRRAFYPGLASALLTLSALVSATPPPNSISDDGGEKAWFAQVPDALKRNPAFTYVVDDPALPRVLLIGDSISIGYTPCVRRLLAGKTNVHRIPVNGENTTLAMKRIDEWLGAGKWDVIHCNWGLHDLTSKGPKTDQYGENLNALLAKLRATGATVIFATTTPIPNGSKGRAPGSELPYNAKALEVLRNNPDVQIDDLFHAALERLPELQKPQDVHFTEHGSEVLGEKVAAAITEALNQRKASSQQH